MKVNHCPQGHPYIGENRVVRVKTKNGKTYTARECRECAQERNRANARLVTLARKDFLKVSKLVPLEEI